MHRYTFDSAEYATAFTALLECFDGRERERAFLRDALEPWPRGARAVDWGAGNGDLTSLLLEHFDRVHAVEPHEGMRAGLATRCPGARVSGGTVTETLLPEAVDVGLLSHVLYHLPDAEWGEAIAHAARQLAPGGALFVSLKADDTGCNDMLEHFGAPRFDLRAALAAVESSHPELVAEFERLPATIATTSLDQTIQVARFMLCDRDHAAFIRPPTEAEFRAHVRDHYWDEAAQRGGWSCDTLFCTVRRRADT